MPDWFSQIEGLIRYHLPAGDGAVPLWAAATAIVVGLILCLAGARLVRTGIVLGFAGAGAAVGAQTAGHFEMSAIMGIVLGVIFAAVIGYSLFRIWVALFAGTIVAGIAACVLMGPNVPAVWQDFEDARITGGATDDVFVLLTPEQQQAAQRVGAAEYLREFGEHLWSRYPGETRRLVAVLVAAFVAGAAIGLFAHRWAIVLGTAAFGTMLILGGAMPLLSRYRPEWVEHCTQRPNEILIGLGIWALIAITCQRRGLRAPTVTGPASSPQAQH